MGVCTCVCVCMRLCMIDSVRARALHMCAFMFVRFCVRVAVRCSHIGSCL